MLEIFTTNKYDDRIAINDGSKDYRISDLKGLVASEISFLKDKKENVVILAGDNFSFIIQFFASLFCSKNIYLITDRARLKNLDFEYELLEGFQNIPINNYKFNIDIHKPLINFYTSGSSGVPKLIKKSLYNLISEAKDLVEELNVNGQDFSIISTTTMCHLFGLTFHLMMPLCGGWVINTRNISYPENVDKSNYILISTPTFLSTVPKFDIPFKIPPKYIITAGSKLNEKVFEYLKKDSEIIDIYGSTETGVIAYKTHSNDDFKLFDNVSIKVDENSAEVKSEYFYEDKITINDRLELKERFLKIKNRTDRLYKIYEKRINANELEVNLKQNCLVEDCFITKYGEKLVCLCALSEIGKEYLLKNKITLLTKNLKRHLFGFSEIVPQKWKYIDKIPMTKTGKIDQNRVKHLFDVKLSLPVILDRTLSEDNITYKILFYDRCNFFNGHFPEFKLVPGVVQLYIAKEFANIHFDLDLGQGQWKRIKFSNIIEPNSIINLKLEKKDNQISYEFYSDKKKYASGVFLCENVFEGVAS